MQARAEPTPASDLMGRLIEHRAQFVELARSIVGCRVKAEDIVQDTAVRLCQQAETSIAVDPGRFLNRMVRNLAIDALRQGKRELRLAKAQEADDRAATSRDCPLRLICARQELRCVLGALEAAPLRTRQAFVAHRFDGLPQRDIAAQFGVSATLVNFMIRDATALCREAVAS